MYIAGDLNRRSDLAKLVLTGVKQQEFVCAPISTKFKLKTLSGDEEIEALAETSQYAGDMMLRIRMNRIVTLARAIISWNDLQFGGDGPNAVKAESFLAALQSPIFDFIWWCYEDLIRLRNMEMEDLILNIKKSLGSRGPEGFGSSSPQTPVTPPTTESPQKST